MDTQVGISLSICSTELWLLWLIVLVDICLLISMELLEKFVLLLIKAVDVGLNPSVDLVDDLLPLVFFVSSS